MFLRIRGFPIPFFKKSLTYWNPENGFFAFTTEKEKREPCVAKIAKKNFPVLNVEEYLRFMRQRFNATIADVLSLFLFLVLGAEEVILSNVDLEIVPFKKRFKRLFQASLFPFWNKIILRTWKPTFFLPQMCI